MSAALVVCAAVLGGCHDPNRSVTYNPYARVTGRPLLKQAEDLPNAAGKRLDHFESFLNNLLD